jgi:4-oxalocrotonate tautomerase
MPMVTIQIVREAIAADPEAKKAAIAEKVVAAITEATGLPKTAVWVVFDEVAGKDWFVGDETAAAWRKKAGL